MLGQDILTVAYGKLLWQVSYDMERDRKFQALDEECWTQDGICHF